jgi:hypothetical protein
MRVHGGKHRILPTTRPSSGVDKPTGGRQKLFIVFISSTRLTSINPAPKVNAIDGDDFATSEEFRIREET